MFTFHTSITVLTVLTEFLLSINIRKFSFSDHVAPY